MLLLPQFYCTCLIKSTHYKFNKFKYFRFQILSFAVYSIYQRTILFSVSIVSDVNLNYILCMSSADPFAKLYGYWYYVFSEFYLNLSSYLTKLAFLILADNIAGFYSIFSAWRISKNFKKERISQNEFKKMI